MPPAGNCLRACRRVPGFPLPYPPPPAPTEPEVCCCDTEDDVGVGDPFCLKSIMVANLVVIFAKRYATHTRRFLAKSLFRQIAYPSSRRALSDGWFIGIRVLKTRATLLSSPAHSSFITPADAIFCSVVADLQKTASHSHTHAGPRTHGAK